MHVQSFPASTKANGNALTGRLCPGMVRDRLGHLRVENVEQLARLDSRRTDRAVVGRTPSLDHGHIRHFGFWVCDPYRILNRHVLRSTGGDVVRCGDPGGEGKPERPVSCQLIHPYVNIEGLDSWQPQFPPPL